MTKELLSARLRNACAEIRRTPMKISDLIPMLQEAADALDKLYPAEALYAQQSWELHIEQAGAIRELLDLHAPETKGNLQMRLAQVFAHPVQTAALPARNLVYQYQLANGNWIDQDKGGYDYNVKHGQATVRVLCAASVEQPVQPEQEFPKMLDAERRTTLVNSLRASKNWTFDYAEAFVDDYAQPVQPTEDIYSCSPFCDKPACVKEQRDNIRAGFIEGGR